MATGPDAPAQGRYSVYLPTIATIATPASLCFESAPALAFYRLLEGDERQQRATLRCCESLVVAAQRRAFGLTHGDPWAHVDGAGLWPNDYARNAGCHLPDAYPPHANNIESIVAGSPDVGIVFEALAQSPRHAAHLFGLLPFFQEQTQCGIAMAEGGPWGWVWVIHIGICEKVSGE